MMKSPIEMHTKLDEFVLVWTNVTAIGRSERVNEQRDGTGLYHYYPKVFCYISCFGVFRPVFSGDVISDIWGLIRPKNILAWRQD